MIKEYAKREEGIEQNVRWFSRHRIRDTELFRSCTYSL
jgi:hypothetical protein